MAIYCYEKLMANELIVTEGDFQKRVDALSLTLNAQQVGVKEFLISLMVEHDRKDDIRFHSVEQSVIAVTSALKDSVNASTANMKDFLVTNNERITAAFTTLSGRFETIEEFRARVFEQLQAFARKADMDALLSSLEKSQLKAESSLNSRFESVNEFRAQLADQQRLFARKTDIDAAMMSSEKAILKAEAAVEKRFDSVNEFRAQMADMQTSLVRKTEVDIRFDALEKKLDTAVAQLQISEGRRSGISLSWGIMVSVITLGIAIMSVAVAVLVK